MEKTTETNVVAVELVGGPLEAWTGNAAEEIKLKGIMVVKEKSIQDSWHNILSNTYLLKKLLTSLTGHHKPNKALDKDS